MDSEQHTESVTLTDTYHEYADTIQKLIVQEDLGQIAFGELLHFVSKYVERCKDDPTMHTFFLAEEAFLENLYRQSLELYKKAKEVPNNEFYCSRSTAYILEKNNHFVEAIHFLKKGLEIYPEDYISLKLLAKLLIHNGQEADAAHYHEKLKQMVEKYASNYIQDTESLPMIPELEQEPRNIDVSSTLAEGLTKRQLATLAAVDAEEAPKTGASYSFSHEELPAVSHHDAEGENQKSAAFYQEPPFGSPLYSTSIPYMMRPSFSASSGEHTSSANEPRNALDEMAYLSEQQGSSSNKSLSELLRENFGVDLEGKDNLEGRIKSFKKRHAKLMSQYVEQAQKQTRNKGDFLCILSGWNDIEDEPQTQTGESVFKTIPHHTLFLDTQRKTSGGLYLRWEGKGIAINPGYHFLEHLHQQGLYINDIDYVIVTRTDMDSSSDLKRIYNLNYQHNTLSEQLHVIHYYLNQHIYHQVSVLLKPHFKQERNTVHSLELYLDSPNAETVPLNPHTTLTYFHNASPETHRGDVPLNVGLRLDLKTEAASAHTQSTLSMAYLTGLKWNPSMAPHLSHTDLIIAAFEHTSPDDYKKVKYNEYSLGYYGISSLLETLSPRLLLCCDFHGKEGDIRLEIAKKLREEFSLKKPRQDTVILPADKGLFVDLKSLRVRCSVSGQLASASQMRVAKTAESFGTLQYLCTTCLM